MRLITCHLAPLPPPHTPVAAEIATWNGAVRDVHRLRAQAGALRAAAERWRAGTLAAATARHALADGFLAIAHQAGFLRAQGEPGWEPADSHAPPPEAMHSPAQALSGSQGQGDAGTTEAHGGGGGGLFTPEPSDGCVLFPSPIDAEGLSGFPSPLNGSTFASELSSVTPASATSQAQPPHRRRHQGSHGVSSGAASPAASSPAPETTQSRQAWCAGSFTPGSAAGPSSAAGGFGVDIVSPENPFSPPLLSPPLAEGCAAGLDASAFDPAVDTVTSPHSLDYSRSSVFSPTVFVATAAHRSRSVGDVAGGDGGTDARSDSYAGSGTDTGGRTGGVGPSVEGWSEVVARGTLPMTPGGGKHRLGKREGGTEGVEPGPALGAGMAAARDGRSAWRPSAGSLADEAGCGARALEFHRAARAMGPMGIALGAPPHELEDSQVASATSS